MKTRIQIISFLVVVFVGSITVLYLVSVPTHYSLEIHGMKDTYRVGEEYSFYYTLSGYGNTCGSWLVWFPDRNGVVKTQGEVIDCTQPKNKEFSYDSRKDSRVFSSKVPDIAGTYNVTVSVEKLKDPLVFEFQVVSNSEDDKRRIGWTPAFEYHRVQINGTIAMQICELLELPCTVNVIFDAINRHDKNYTYFYYDFSDKEYLVVLDDEKICYTSDDVDFENTGTYEKCVEIKNADSGAYELDEAMCIGGRGYIKNDQCEIIGKYDPATGLPIVENKEQCDMLDGDWNEQQKTCDSKYGGK